MAAGVIPAAGAIARECSVRQEGPLKERALFCVTRQCRPEPIGDVSKSGITLREPPDQKERIAVLGRLVDDTMGGTYPREAQGEPI